MHYRLPICAASATAALLVLGGCEMFVTSPPNLSDASGEECVVLTTAVEKIADDWRTNPGGHTLQLDAYAISADRIDRDYDSKVSGLLPPKNARPIDVADCGTHLASISTSLNVVWPDHAMPTGDRRSCWRSDGGWISRAAIDGDRTHAAVLYTDDICGEHYWLVRLTKDPRGIWYAEAPDPLQRAAVLPREEN
jgi:hypothetical protein